MDDILTRMSLTTPDSSAISGEGATSESLLPRLRLLDCGARYENAYPFTWDRIPPLYYQGQRWSLTLESQAHESHMSEETALQLLQLVEEGADLRISNLATSEDFLENFRDRMNEGSS